MASVAAAARSDTRPSGRASAVGRNRPGPADTDIVAGLRAREDDALEQLFQRYGPMVTHWARAAGTDVEDVVQDVMLKVWRAGARLEDGTELPAYLKTVTANTIRNRWRTQSRKPTIPVGLDPAGETASGDPALRATDRIAVEQVLGKLRPHERRCLELLYVSDLPLADVARELGATPDATKSLAARARRRIRSDLEKLVGPGAAAVMPWMVRSAEVAEAAGHGAFHKVAATAAAFLTAGALTLAATGDRTPTPAEPPPAETAPLVVPVDESPAEDTGGDEIPEPEEETTPITPVLGSTEPPAAAGQEEASEPDETHERTVENEVQEPDEAEGNPSNPGPDCRQPYPGPDAGAPGPHGPQGAPGNGGAQNEAGPPGNGQGHAENQGRDNGQGQSGSGGSGNSVGLPGSGGSSQNAQPHGAAPGPGCPD